MEEEDLRKDACQMMNHSDGAASSFKAPSTVNSTTKFLAEDDGRKTKRTKTASIMQSIEDDREDMKNLMRQFMSDDKDNEDIDSLIRRLEHDLEMRQKNGWAMSSRNKRLSNIELKNAMVLQKALNHCKNNFRKMDLQALQAECLGILQKESNPEYFEICDAESLSPITEISETKNIRAFTAASIGEIRLIDNMEIL